MIQIKKILFIILILGFFSLSFSNEYVSLSVVADRVDLISEASVDQLFGKCISYRIDTVYLPLISYMEALYISKLLPRSNVLINLSSSITFDPLEYALKKGENFGVRVIPLIDLFTVWPSKDLPINALHVSNKHPEWLSRDSLGRLLTDPVILDPGVNEVQEFIIALVKEVLIKYQPSQLAFSNFGYPNPVYGYNPFSLKKYEQYRRDNGTKIINFDDFRKDVLSDMIKRIAALTQSLGLPTKLYMFHTSNYEKSLEQHFQDWVYWINKTYVDMGVMWYWFGDKKNVAFDTQWALENVLRARIVPALSLDDFQPAQFSLILKTALSFPVSGVVVDTTDSNVMMILNTNKVGIPR